MGLVGNDDGHEPRRVFERDESACRKSKRKSSARGKREKVSRREPTRSRLVLAPFGEEVEECRVVKRDGEGLPVALRNTVHEVVGVPELGATDGERLPESERSSCGLELRLGGRGVVVADGGGGRERSPLSI